MSCGESDEFVIDVSEFDFGFGEEFFFERFWRGLSFNHLADGVKEEFEVVGQQGDAGGMAVTSELMDDVAAEVKGIVDVYGEDAAGRANEEITAAGEYDGRSMKFLNESCGYDADYAF